MWVHRDASNKAQEGSPVVLRSKLINLTSPQDWTISCVLAWVVFFPLYLIGRQHDV
jgi:hypothetical protein